MLRVLGSKFGKLKVSPGLQSMATVYTQADIEKKLKDKLQPCQLEVVDTSGGCGNSFMVSVASSLFEGKTLIARHRLINQALAEEMASIHALSIRSAEPESTWRKQNSA